MLYVSEFWQINQQQKHELDFWMKGARITLETRVYKDDEGRKGCCSEGSIETVVLVWIRLEKMRRRI